MSDNTELPGAAGFVRSLGITARDRILVFTDSQVEPERIEPLLKHLSERAAKVTINNSLPIEFREELPASFSEEAMNHDVLLFMGSQSWYHTKLRKDAKYLHGKRVAEFYNPDARLYHNGAMTANFQEVEELGRKTALPYKPGQAIRVKAGESTDFTATIETVSVESGLYDKPGTGGNLPAGEVSLGIREGSCNGKVTFDVNFEIVGKSELPVTLFIQAGRITKAVNGKGEDISGILVPETIRNIAEVGIGINPKAIMGRSILEDEKVLGTAHVGIGSNTYFGGIITGPHFDGVFLKPEIAILATD